MSTMDPQLHAQRYGAPRPGRRRLVVALVAVGTVVSLVWLAWTALVHSRPDVRSELRSYEVVSPSEAQATVLIDRSGTDVEATCVVQAYAEDFSAVGQRVFTMDAADPEDATFDLSIRTERPAVQVVATGCTSPDQPRAR